MAFGGTFTLTLGTLHALLRDLCSAILRAGLPEHPDRERARREHPRHKLTRELGAPITCTT